MLGFALIILVGKVKLVSCGEAMSGLKQHEKQGGLVSFGMAEGRKEHSQWLATGERG